MASENITFTDKELKTLTDSELLNMLVSACKQVAHESEYGRWGDGGLESAKRERNQLKRLVLGRMGGRI
jgi:hypothetical protein